MARPGRVDTLEALVADIQAHSLEDGYGCRITTRYRIGGYAGVYVPKALAEAIGVPRRALARRILALAQYGARGGEVHHVCGRGTHGCVHPHHICYRDDEPVRNVLVNLYRALRRNALEQANRGQEGNGED